MLAKIYTVASEVHHTKFHLVYFLKMVYAMKSVCDPHICRIMIHFIQMLHNVGVCMTCL